MLPKQINSLWFRMFLGFAVPLALFLAAAIVAFVTINRLTNSFQKLEVTEQLLANIDQLQESLQGMAAAKRAHHLLGKDRFVAQFSKHRVGFLQKLKMVQEKLQEKSNQLQVLQEVQIQEANWSAQAKTSFEVRKKPNLIFGQPWFDIVAKFELEKSMDEFDEIVTNLKKLRATEAEAFQQYKKDVLARTKENNLAIFTAVLVSICFAIATSWLFSRSIARPIQHLRRAVKSIQEGKIETVTAFGPSEIMELIRGFNLMSIALAERNLLLEGNELRYRTVVGTTSQMLWTTTADGENMEMANWCALTGQQPEETIGDGWLEAVHPDDRDRFVAHWKQVLEMRRYAEDEFRIRKHNGKYHDYQCRSIPIFNSREEIIEWVRICVDITDKNRQAKLRRERDSAEAASRAKSEFLAKMSHELRTPLNAIIGMSKMLTTERFGKLNEKQQDYLTDVVDAGTHLLQLINDILDLSKVEAGRLDLHPEVIRVGETVDGLISTLASLASQKQLDLRTELPEPDGTMTTDISRFKQILYNLVSNAIKFTPEGGKVIVRCHWIEEATRAAPVAPLDESKALRVDVEDDGIGIAEEDQQQIGSEFFQAVSDPNKAQEGTGLGLALCQRLVGLLGGTIWFTSEHGKGSTFSFALPRDPTSSSVRDQSILASDADENIPSGQSKLLIGRPLALIIDDHAPTNKLLRDWLDEAGMDAASAFDGTTGLEQARELQPQLILLDVRLPGKNGFEVLHALKGEPTTANIPVVMVTVLEGMAELRELDIVDWFVKPLEKETMLTRLQSSLPTLFSTGQARVLVVDDDDLGRAQFRDLLRSEGLTVLEAEDGQKALELMEQQSPDLVILDVFAPKIDGFEFVQQIRQRDEWKHLPIIIVTERALRSEERQRLDGDILGIYRKDAFTKEQFAARVQRLFQHKPVNEEPTT